MAQSRKRPSRAAFTLVELLVVISIIGVLMALLLPAVNAARIAAYRTTCQQRMKEIGRGTQLYEQSKKKFPSSFTWAESTKILPAAQWQTFPWTVRLLPEIEQQKLYDDVMYRNTNVAARTDFIETFVCQADAEASEGPSLSYVANTGRPDVLDSPLSASDITDPHNFKATGVFHDARAFPNHDVTQAFISKADGTTNTLLYTENRNATFWNLQPAVDQTDEHLMGFVWTDVPNGEPPQAIPNSPDQGAAPNTYLLSRPAANHADTFNNVFADGSVRALSQEIDYGVFYRLMTPDGAKTNVNWQAAPVQAQDLQL